MTRLAAGRLLVVAGALALLFDSAGPWYEARPSAVRQAAASYAIDCSSLSGADKQACQDNAAAAVHAALHSSTDPGSPASLAGFAWPAWPAGPHAWGPVLLLLAAAAAVVLRVLHRLPAGRAEAVTVTAIAAAALLITLAVVHLPSPDGVVPGSQVWARGWALWLAAACVLVAAVGAGLILADQCATARARRRATWAIQPERTTESPGIDSDILGQSEPDILGHLPTLQ